MNRAAILDAIFELLSQTAPSLVIKVPEGIALLGNDGRHYLIRCDAATLEVVSP